MLSSTQETNKLLFFRLKNYIKTTTNLLLRKRLFIASVFAHSCAYAFSMKHRQGKTV